MSLHVEKFSTGTLRISRFNSEEEFYVRNFEELSELLKELQNHKEILFSKKKKELEKQLHNLQLNIADKADELQKIKNEFNELYIELGNLSLD